MSIEIVKRVCFICGSHTKTYIDIYQPRPGPSIVEIIRDKFRIPPENEDKYLCFSCNNWLINWNSLQNKNDSSAVFTESDHHRQISSPEDAADCVVAELRANLKKYFYLRKDLSPTTMSSVINNQQNPTITCYTCPETPTKSDYRQRRRIRRRLFKTRRQRRSTKVAPPTINPDVVNKLNKLGTTIYTDPSMAMDFYNGCSDGSDGCASLLWDDDQPRDHREILVTFNRTIAEVFSVNLQEGAADEYENNENIYERIPKSLTITLASSQ